MIPKPRPNLTFLIGGARSGKSAHAEGLITALPPPWHYLATAKPFDAEMTARIGTHRDRRGEGWITTEAPLDLADAVRAVPQGTAVLVDCLTLWLTNTMLAERRVDDAIDGLIAALATLTGPCSVVSTEVGLGIVPDTALAREFRDHAGRLHQRVAAVAGRVLLVVAGIAMVVK